MYDWLIISQSCLEIRSLCHIITTYGIKIDEEMEKIIQQIPEPLNVQEVICEIEDTVLVKADNK